MADPTGSLIKGAFGSDKVNQLYYNKQANKNLDWLGKQFGGDDARMQGWLDDYITANTSRIANVDRLAGQAEGDYNDLFKQWRAYDPTNTYERVRAGNLEAFNQQAGALEDRGRRQDALAAAALGQGGRPDGSYDRALRYDRVSRNTAPVLGTIFNNLGSDTAALEAARNYGTANAANMIGARTGTAFLSDGMQLGPLAAFQAIRGNQIGQLGDIIGAARNNSAGWQQERNWADRMGDGMNAANDATWQNVGNAMKVYSSLYGGGMLGGGGGGGIMSMFGGGGGGGLSYGNPYASGAQIQWSPPSQLFSEQPSMYMGNNGFSPLFSQGQTSLWGY